jgi:dihydroneopterin aldolase
LTDRSVFIEGMKLWVRCGVYEEERRLGVQLKLSVELTSSDFIDYQELHRLILEVAKGEYTYLEEFQDSLFEKFRERWNLDSVIIETVKLTVPFQHNFERVGVRLKWNRR